ncbi:MAG: Altered inheritance of mitochondria protein 18 mitochondrial [Alectoria sarmentosa]|nr:MAG: Altered inheritance of mitochondria protein 18 mitochondrial [Alectoria sarmentosa]
MRCSPSTINPRTIYCLHCNSNAPLRSPLPIPRLARQVPSRSHAYSTQPPSPQARYRPNYRVALYCGLTAVAATWAVTRQKAERLDAPPYNRRDELTSGARVEITSQDHRPDIDQVPTGTSTVPYFPRSIWLPRSGGASEEDKSPALPAGIGAAQDEEEYQLLGLGIRKVSFLRIQVYVVGLYIAKGDLGRLQEELVRASVGSGASTLVQGEKEDLKKTLLDGEGSTKVWSEVLKEGEVRSAVRVVPTRDTNFSHMRDGWIRGIDLRGKGKEFEDEEFKMSVDQFKGMLGGRGSVGKGKVLLLGRWANGALRAWVEENAEEADSKTLTRKRGPMTLLGTVKDERISRLIWMGYLAGQNIASEDARRSIVDGVIEIVERPLGTIETQVV